VCGVTHHFGLRPILKNVSLSVRTGELLCIMGPNGMGKTTLLNVMAGTFSPARGYVEIDGKRRRNTEEEELAIRQKTVFLPDDPWMVELGGRNILMAVGRLYGHDELHLMEHVDSLLRLFNIEKLDGETTSSYSAGQKKKLALCSALVTEAPVMILDEPFSGGLDPSGLQAIQTVLKQLAEREDVTIVMATPVPELVEGLAHRVAVIKDGEIIACDSIDGLRNLTGCSGPLQEVLEEIIHPHTQDRVESYLKGRERC
jgi:ABC-type multidrug transport system ATPase subunit